MDLHTSPHYTTFSASSTSPFNITITFDGLMVALFLCIFVISLVQLFRLWMLASKLSNRKRVFICLILSIAVRMAWFLLQSLMDESFGASRQSFSTIVPLVSLGFYYAPMLLMYTACSYLILNWFQLYQKEKLRKKFRDRGRQQLPPIVKKQRSEARRNLLWTIHAMLNATIYLFSGVSISTIVFSSNGWPSNLNGEWLPTFEMTLASLCLLFLLVLSYMGFRRLGKTYRAKTSDSWKLRVHTVLTQFLVVLVGVYFLGMISLHGGALLMTFHHGPAAHGSAVLLRIYEAAFLLLAVVVLGFQTLSLRAPLPTNTHSITQEWLTSVLREAGLLKSYTSVVGCFTQNLKGGCHFKVVRVLLKCASLKLDEGAPKTNSGVDAASILPSAGDSGDMVLPHESLVVKLLYWNKPILDRIWTYIKYLLKLHDPEVIYLRSYQVEHLFYKKFHLSRKLAGLKTPEVYFNLEDVFNNRFAMVQQDLSHLEDCQPNGFSVANATIALRCLARFHATNWHISRKKNADLKRWAWNFAAFWTGERESDTSQVKACWNRAVANFPELELSQFGDLGEKLHVESPTIRKKFHKCCSVYRTLCHGDFKISNLFLDIPKNDEALQLGASNYLLSMPRRGHFKSPRSHSRHPIGTSSVHDHIRGGGHVDGDDDEDALPSPTSLYAIDFQWFGFGNACIDVAAFLCTSLRVEDLDAHHHLLQVYHEELLANGVDDYPYELFISHYRLCVLEFGIYCIISKWSKMTEIDFASYAAKIKDGLHLRSKPHMMSILKYVAYFVETYREDGSGVSEPLIPDGFVPSKTVTTSHHQETTLEQEKNK